MKEDTAKRNKFVLMVMAASSGGLGGFMDFGPFAMMPHKHYREGGRTVSAAALAVGLAHDVDLKKLKDDPMGLARQATELVGHAKDKVDSRFSDPPSFMPWSAVPEERVRAVFDHVVFKSEGGVKSKVRDALPIMNSGSPEEGLSVFINKRTGDVAINGTLKNGQTFKGTAQIGFVSGVKYPKKRLDFLKAVLAAVADKSKEANLTKFMEKKANPPANPGTPWLDVYSPGQRCADKEKLWLVRVRSYAHHAVEADFQVVIKNFSLSPLPK